MMRTIQLSALPKEIRDLIKHAEEAGERLAIKTGSKRLAWIVGEYDIGTLKCADRREMAIDLKAVRAARLEEGGIPWERVKRDLGLD